MLPAQQPPNSQARTVGVDACITEAIDSSSPLPEVCAADLHRDDLTGLRLSQYALGKKLGQGGMGCVFSATHLHLGKRFAIKFIRPELMSSEGKQRFLNEIQAVGKLSHPNLVNAIDAGQQGQLLYCVTELLEGQNLENLVELYGPMPPEAAAEIVCLTAQGLEYAHRNGFVHRDIKPSNIILESSCNVRLLDFGLAKHATASEQCTRADQLLGTVDFISPEQARNATTVTAQSDLYSLGATLSFMLTGQSIFPDVIYPTVANKLTAIVTQVPAIVKHAKEHWPGPISKVLSKTLTVEPKERLESAACLVELLKPIASQVALKKWLGGKRNSASSHMVSELVSPTHEQRATFTNASLLSTFFINRWRASGLTHKLVTFAALAAFLLASIIGLGNLQRSSSVRATRTNDASTATEQIDRESSGTHQANSPVMSHFVSIATDGTDPMEIDRISDVPRNGSSRNAAAFGLHVKSSPVKPIAKP